MRKWSKAASFFSTVVLPYCLDGLKGGGRIRTGGCVAKAEKRVLRHAQAGCVCEHSNVANSDHRGRRHTPIRADQPSALANGAIFMLHGTLQTLNRAGCAPPKPNKKTVDAPPLKADELF